MALERFDKLEAERRERLFRVAAEEFAERGYQGASVNRIVERAGLSKGALYYYFEDKDDLYSTVVEQATAKLVEVVGGLPLADLTADTYWPAVETFVRRSTGYLASHEWYVKLARSFYRLRGRSGQNGPAGTVFRWALGWVQRALERGQDLGVIRTDLPRRVLAELTMAVGEVCDRWMLERWNDMGPDTREGLVAAALGIFRRMLAPAIGASP